MPTLHRLLLPLVPTSIAAAAMAGPDEDKLGKAQGYPAGNAKNWCYDESVRVNSFTSEGEMPGIFNGKSNVQAAANATAKTGGTMLGRDADAFWRGVVRQYGRW